MAKNTTLDEEDRERIDSDDDAAFLRLVERLSRQSVDKHYDAYADIDWDAPGNEVDPTDIRFKLPSIDPLGATEWYQSQPPDVQARIGLWRIATAMRVGMQFENILKRGLLVYATFLPNGSPEFRYAYHETIEEAHHGLMFQEFANRSGLDIKGLPWWMRGAPGVVLLARIFPELFFFFVLGGEDPIDHVQRQALRNGHELHPLVHQIMRHHVTEEARHLSFARHLLKRRVARLGPVRRGILSVAVPAILGGMAAIMLAPPPAMIREFKIPATVIREAYGDKETAGDEARGSLRKVRNLAVELGLVNRRSLRIWKALRIWEDPASAGESS